MGENKLSTVCNKDFATKTFRITHPFHPLFGKEYQVVDLRQGWGVNRVYYHEPVTGVLRSIPSSWTSVVAKDPFEETSKGRAYFRTKDLLELVDELRKLGTGK